MVTYAVNTLARVALNTALDFVPLSIPVNLMGNYALDLGLVYKIAMNAAYTTLFLRAEVYNTVTGKRPVVPAPTDIKSVPITNPTSFEFLMNENIMRTLFASLAQNGDLKVTLTDAQVYNMTGFLHLRTSDFSYYIPGLDEFGDVPMTLTLSATELPQFDILKDKSEIKLSGPVYFDFAIANKGILVKLLIKSGLSLSARIDSAKKDLYAKINGIGVNDIQIVDVKISKKPDVAALMKEFNILFKFVVNAVNIMALEKPTHIPESIVVSFITVIIKSVSMRILNGIFGVASEFSINM